jgi:lipopolysaccharide export system protein LptA
MRNRIERLRVWLLAGAGLLLVVLAVFIGSARYLMHHFLARLPAKLGINIKSETNGFTYSQSLQGKTVYTIHAAKEVEHTDGKITLHGVTMVLYGRKGDRADEIKGDEFEYDQSAGMVRAIGPVHIDLRAAEAGEPDAHVPTKAAGRGLKAGVGDDKILHATTSGLI